LQHCSAVTKSGKHQILLIIGGTEKRRIENY
jgi:hypothetical protein